MNKHLYIITGASRGLGLAIAQQLLKDDHLLLCMSRQNSQLLGSQASLARCSIEQWSTDLVDSAVVAQRLFRWLTSVQVSSLKSATLINNAAMIPNIAPLCESHADETQRALRVGLEAPMLLSAAFLKSTETLSAPRKILNISSGLGRRPMASQSAYCAAKAGMDHFSRCLALDEALRPNGAKVCSLAPGVIDTDMQVQLRNAPVDGFPDQAAFAHLKATGQLSNAHDTAKRVLAWLARADFGEQAVADVRDA
jgi:NAD(P)-dependent dehydrogenase (short-subunit alcohol dehydrogenase family)